MKRKTGHHYEAKVEIEFADAAQARDFASKDTLIGKQVEADLKDDEYLEALEAGEPQGTEINYPDAFDERAQEEIEAAKHVGAETVITFSWIKDV